MKYEEIKMMYNLEANHWWFTARRRLIVYLFEKYCKRGLLLDLGCGTGINLSTFKKFTKVKGIDSSLLALEFCRKRGHNNVVKAKAEKLPFKDNAFDTILALDILEHIKYDDKVLAETYRVLKKDGILILTVPALKFLWTEHDNIFEHKRRYNTKGLKSKLEKQKYKIKKISYWNFILFPLMMIYKFINRKSHLTIYGRLN